MVADESFTRLRRASSAERPADTRVNIDKDQDAKYAKGCTMELSS